MSDAYPDVTPLPSSGGSVNAAATERATRTFIQGLALDVLIAIGLVLSTTAYDGLTNKAAWTALAIALGKSVVQAVVSYAMRKYAPPATETATAA